MGLWSLVVLEFNWVSCGRHSLVLADVVSIERTNESFRLMYDSKGRFVLHRIGADEQNVRFALILMVVWISFVGGGCQYDRRMPCVSP